MMAATRPGSVWIKTNARTGFEEPPERGLEDRCFLEFLMGYLLGGWGLDFDRSTGSDSIDLARSNLARFRPSCQPSRNCHRRCGGQKFY